MLHGMGIETGMDLDKTVQIGQWISDEIGRQNASRVGRALIAKVLPKCTKEHPPRCSFRLR